MKERLNKLWLQIILNPRWDFTDVEPFRTCKGYIFQIKFYMLFMLRLLEYKVYGLSIKEIYFIHMMVGNLAFKMYILVETRLYKIIVC